MSAPAEASAPPFRWLRTGEAALSAMLDAIGRAARNIRLETYIFEAGGIGDRFRQALVEAARRGVQVRVLVDTFGSIGLADSYWKPLRDAGGIFRWFNPRLRPGCRDHRKLLVVDESISILGGFNIAADYFGDGVTRGWRDLGLKCVSPSLAAELADGFDSMFDPAAPLPRRAHLLRRARHETSHQDGHWRLILSGPGWGHHPLKHTLAADLAAAKTLRIIAAYFLPTRPLRREIIRAARAGRSVQLILAGRSDVKLAQLANRHLYRNLLRAGVEIHEYQPQILHAKLLILDDVVYAGSANLDTRSLTLNYELLLRIQDPDLAAGARDLFQADLARCRRVDFAQWRGARALWSRLLESAAFFLLTRVDPYLARRGPLF